MSYDWNATVVDQLKQWWTEGHSAGRIAALLGGGLTRNAVIGKVHRMGLAGRPERGITKVLREHPTLRSKPPGLSLGARMAAIGRGPHPQARRLENGAPITTADIKDCHCRWPHGEVGTDDFHYCGLTPVKGSPWCEFHHARATAKPHVPSPDAAARGRQTESMFAKIWG